MSELLNEPLIVVPAVILAGLMFLMIFAGLCAWIGDGERSGAIFVATGILLPIVLTIGIPTLIIWGSYKIFSTAISELKAMLFERRDP